MVANPAELIELIKALIADTEPDGRYAVDKAGFESSWTVSPDNDERFAPRDLLARVQLGGPRVVGDQLVYPIGILVLTAAYHGTRTALGSGLELTSEARIHGAALHLLERLERLAVPGGRVSPNDFDTPSTDAGNEWHATVVTATMAIARR
jgi:hypothetical protein